MNRANRAEMRKWMIPLVALLILAFIACIVVIVQFNGITPSDDGTSTTTDSANNGGEPAPDKDSGGVDYTVIDGRKYEFVSDKEKQSWIEPVAELISNMKVTDSDSVFIDGTPAIDPNAPTVEYSVSFALYDVNFDGVPELLAEPWGYSGSNAYFEYWVYDIFSGDLLGEIHGKGSGSIAVYYSSVSKDIQNIGFSSIRGGYFSRNEFISVIECDSQGKCQERSWLSCSTEIYHEREQNGDLYERYEMSYGVNGNNASFDEYNSEYNRFLNNYVRLPETEIVFYSSFSFYYGCDYEKTGLEIATALINESQKIIKP